MELTFFGRNFMKKLTLVLASAFMGLACLTGCPGNKHEHDFSILRYDEENHWYECECGEKDEKVAHTFDQKVIDDKYYAEDANYGHGELYYYSCVCGKHNDETFEVGEPIQHQHIFDYKGDCIYTDRGCTDSVRVKTKLGEKITINKIGLTVLEFTNEFNGYFVCDVDHPEYTSGIIDLHLNPSTAPDFLYPNTFFALGTLDTRYYHINVVTAPINVSIVCDHNYDHTGVCTQCGDVEGEMHNLVLNQEKTEFINNANAYFKFVPTATGAYELSCSGENSSFELYNEGGVPVEFVVDNIFNGQENNTYYLKVNDNATEGENVTVKVSEYVGDVIMTMTDIFTITGKGVVVTGKLLKGTIVSEQKLTFVCTSDSSRTKTVQIRNIEMFSKALTFATEGNTIGFTIVGDYEKADFDNTMVIVDTASTETVTSFFANTHILSKDEGGRKTPFISPYRPQFVIEGFTFGITALLVGYNNGAYDPDDTLYAPGTNSGFEFVLPEGISVPKKIVTPGTKLAVVEGGKTVAEGAVVDKAKLSTKLEYVAPWIYKYTVEKTFTIREAYWKSTSSTGTLYYKDASLTTCANIELAFYTVSWFAEIISYQQIGSSWVFEINVIYSRSENILSSSSTVSCWNPDGDVPVEQFARWTYDKSGTDATKVTISNSNFSEAYAKLYAAFVLK